MTEPYFNWVTDAVARMLVDYATNGQPTANYHRWYKWLNAESPRETHEFAFGAAVGAGHVAQKASDAISEVIEEITEPVKPKRVRKSTSEGAKTAVNARRENRKGREERITPISFRAPPLMIGHRRRS